MDLGAVFQWCGDHLWTLMAAGLLIVSILVPMVFRSSAEPVALEASDPAIAEATRLAQHSLPVFRQLTTRFPTPMVKVKFVTDTDEVEYLWAIVRVLPKDLHPGTELTIEYENYPVSHRGHLDQRATVTVSEHSRLACCPGG